MAKKKGEQKEEATQQQEVKEVDVPIDQVKMQENEALRLVITKGKDNALSILVKTQEGDNVQEVSFFEVIGVLETAKSDMLNQQQGAPQNQEQQLVPITLEQEDFELDFDGRLAASGKKVGDVIQVPAMIAQLREQSIDSLKRRKSGNVPTHMSVVDPADSQGDA